MFLLPESGDFIDNKLDCRLGPLTLAFEPRLSCLCSLSREAFISLGFGVLNIVLFSRHRALPNQNFTHKHFILRFHSYLLNSLKTTQIVINISIIATKIPIIAGSLYFGGPSSSIFIAAKMFLVKQLSEKNRQQKTHPRIPFYRLYV